MKVAVKYCAIQPSGFVYPIERFDFQITMNNGFEVKKEVEWRSGPAASELSPNTTFSVEALLEGPADKTGVKDCDGKNGRGNIRMAVTVKFIGYYGSGSENLKTVTLTKTWTQDSLDMLRQEYVDMTPPDSRAELPVPGRSEFDPEISSNGVDDWNTGHYTYMIDDGLKAKKAAWLKEVNAYRETIGKAVFSDKAFTVNSAYRNPYHQRFHVAASQGKRASFHSRHCYGDALDIQTLDVDGDGDVEQAVGKKAKSDDGILMEEHAILAGAKLTLSWKYYSKHTHADWTSRSSWPPPRGTVYSPPCDPPKDKSSSTTTSTKKKASLSPSSDTDAKEAVKLLACGHAVGTPGYHDKIYCGFCRAPTYACLRDDGHGPVRCPKDSDGQTCTVDEGWQIACADPPHVCKYPSATQPQPVVTPPKETTQPKPQPKPEPPPVVSPPKETPPPQWVACGNSSCSEGGKVLSVNAHKVVCPNNPSHTYWSCNPGGVAYHTNLHTCTKCSQTYSGCTRSGCPRGGSHTQKAQTPTTLTTPPTNNNNGNSNNNNNVPKSPSKPDPPPVSYHPCGVHPTTVSGDHSLQASCSRDSRCIATNFYYCQHTRHTYPVPPPPKKPDPPKPPPPKKCPAHRWTNCGSSTSHATTCRAGHTYYTCNPNAVKAHKWHVKAGVNCPAHAWTNCNGATSHSTTCGQGHKYYTCNPKAVTAHSWH